jgi:hypothetical protein
MADAVPSARAACADALLEKQRPIAELDLFVGVLFCNVINVQAQLSLLSSGTPHGKSDPHF